MQIKRVRPKRPSFLPMSENEKIIENARIVNLRARKTLREASKRSKSSNVLKRTAHIGSFLELRKELGVPRKLVIKSRK
ncbi:MAG: hypothetical protein WC462_01220 [archaeon]